MKHSFFGDLNPAIPEKLSVYILSLIDPVPRQELCTVNKTWKKVIEKTNEISRLVPIFKRIPILYGLSLAQLSVYPMSGGMTNRNYLLKSSPDKWVLRIAGKSADTFVNRAYEYHNARQADALSLNAHIDYFDPVDGLQLTTYLQDSVSLDTISIDHDILRKVAGILKVLHQSDGFPNSLKVFANNKSLLSQLRNKAFKLPEDLYKIEQGMEKIEAAFNRYKIKLVPCHNDTTPGNFLVSQHKKGIKLIDWEYASNNDFLWDLAYFSLESQLTAQQEDHLLNAYFTELNSSILAWFELYKPIIKWWGTLWSWLQIANESDACELDLYREYAATSYEETKRYLSEINLSAPLEELNHDSGLRCF